MFAWSEVCGERPAVMGIVNVTPDSFSDGGRFLDPDAAVAHGLELVAAGADLLDVGGESTRPGAEPVDEDEELRRVLPVVRRLAAEAGVPVSIDTSKAAVAAAALDAGATIVNDVSAGADPEMFARGRGRRCRASWSCTCRASRARCSTTRTTTTSSPRSATSSLDRLAAARAAGVDDGALCADPGLGFGKTAAHNLELLARLGELVARVDVPVLRRPVAQVVHRARARRRPRHDIVARDDGTLATAVWAVDHGARVVRVHDAGAAADALRLLAVMDADRRGGGGVKGRWAQGLEPRAFCWIIKDRLAASERPGGFARNHRKVRRQEELIWLIGHGFTHILSMLDSPHNLHAYDEAGIPHAHVPIGRHDEWPDTLPRLYATLAVVVGQPAGARAHPPRGVRRPPARRARRVPPLRGSRHRGSARDRSSSRRSPVASSARWRARSSPSPSTRASWPAPVAERPGADHGNHRHQGTARARRARRAARGADRGPSRSRSTSSSPSTSRSAGESDALDDTVDYSAVAEAVSRVVTSERYYAARTPRPRASPRCAGSTSASPASTVTVRKLHPPVRAMVEYVAVRIEQ